MKIDIALVEKLRSEMNTMEIVLQSGGTIMHQVYTKYRLSDGTEIWNEGVEWKLSLEKKELADKLIPIIEKDKDFRDYPSDLVVIWAKKKLS